MIYLTLLATLALLGGCGMAIQESTDDEAPYIGQYTLQTGGGDAMSGVYLLLLKGGDYVIAYFGGMQQGTWNVLPNGELELTEWPTDPVDFYVFGTRTLALGDQVQLKLKGFEEATTKIGFTAPSAGQLSLHPAFSLQANGYEVSYKLKRPVAETQAIYLTVYQDERVNSDYQEATSKVVLYTFPLDQRYNDYLVMYHKGASMPAGRYIGRFTDKKLTLYKVTNHQQRGDSYGERSAIGPNDLEEIPRYLQAARQKVPVKLEYRETSEGKATTYHRLMGTSQPLKNLKIKLLGPLFKTSYD